MRSAAAGEVRETATSAAVAAAWTQWASIAAAALPVEARPASTIVDPEALVLASVAFQSAERRLLDLAAGFARIGGWLLSVTRVKRLAGSFGSEASRLLPLVASAAVRGGYKHWEPMARAVPSDVHDRGKDLGNLRLLEPSALMLRLRAGFGLSAKPDVLAFLLGNRAGADVKTMQTALGYLGRGIRIAAETMASAGFIERVEGSPVTYRADLAAWAQVLHSHRPESADGGVLDLPRWHDWAGVFAFLTSARDWAAAAEDESRSDYLASSGARDVAAKYHRVLRQAHASFALRDDARGATYLDVFRRAVSRVAAWTRSSLLVEDPT